MKIASPLPLFNTPSFYEELQNGSVNLDSQGLWRPLEVILPPESAIQIISLSEEPLVSLLTTAYPGKEPFYTLESFIKRDRAFNQQKKALPPLKEFIQRIHFCLDQSTPYLWGGNYPEGLPLLQSLYPKHNSLSSAIKNIYALRGVDCSGLIYWAAKESTGRNSSDLLVEGKAVAFSSLSFEEMLKTLLPGMIIVWKGHVLVVTDRGIVESELKAGKVICSAKEEKLKSLLSEKTPLDTWPLEAPKTPSFVVRDLYQRYTQEISKIGF